MDRPEQHPEQREHEPPPAAGLFNTRSDARPATPTPAPAEIASRFARLFACSETRTDPFSRDGFAGDCFA